MTSKKPGITSRYDDEQLRVQEQTQLIYLQNQIDELRRLLKEQNNKYAWAVEQVRRVEAQNAQLQGLIERQAQEQQVVLEAYKREISNLRRDVAQALLRAEESVKPVRELQATLHQLGESRRNDREQIAPLFARVDELEQRVREQSAQLLNADERHRQTLTQIEQLRLTDSDLLDELRRQADEIKAEKQTLRRQAVEAQQLVSDARAAMEEPLARLKRLEECSKNAQEHLQRLPAELERINQRLSELRDEIRRVELLSTERFMMSQERLEELRHQSEERLTDLHNADEEHLRHLTGWLERIDAWCREDEGRLTRVANRLELLLQRHETRLAALETQEDQLLERLSETWRALLEARRAAAVEQHDTQAS